MIEVAWGQMVNGLECQKKHLELLKQWRERGGLSNRITELSLESEESSDRRALEATDGRNGFVGHRGTGKSQSTKPSNVGKTESVGNMMRPSLQNNLIRITG